MSPLDVEDDLTEALPRPRFPALRVSACAVGLLAAAYLWLGWGWRWDVTPGGIVGGRPPIPFPGGWGGRYVRILGCGVWRTERSATGTITVLRDDALVRPSLLVPRNWGGKLPCAFFHLNDRDPEPMVVACLAGDRWPEPSAPSGPLRFTELVGLTDSRGDGSLIHRTIPGAPVVDTSRGRINAYTALAFVLAFWSVVFGRMWIREWRGEQQGDSPHRG